MSLNYRHGTTGSEKQPESCWDFPPQPARAHSRNQLDVVIAFCLVIANHSLDSLQCELFRQVAMV